MNSAFIVYEELSRSRGCYPPRPCYNTLRDLLNSSYPTKAEFEITLSTSELIIHFLMENRPIL